MDQAGRSHDSTKQRNVKWHDRYRCNVEFWWSTSDVFADEDEVVFSYCTESTAITSHVVYCIYMLLQGSSPPAAFRYILSTRQDARTGLAPLKSVGGQSLPGFSIVIFDYPIHLLLLRSTIC